VNGPIPGIFDGIREGVGPRGEGVIGSTATIRANADEAVVSAATANAEAATVRVMKFAAMILNHKGLWSGTDDSAMASLSEFHAILTLIHCFNDLQRATFCHQSA
jgi:hypothetical protein